MSSRIHPILEYRVIMDYASSLQVLYSTFHVNFLVTIKLLHPPQDNADNCSTTDFPDQVLIPTMKEMVNQYKVSCVCYSICDLPAFFI